MTVPDVAWERRILVQADSTSDEVRRLAVAGEVGPLWVMAHHQTAARGRRARAWLSDAGNLAASLLIRPDASPGHAATLSFVAALAVSDLVRGLALAQRVSLKWPNDVLLNGAKVAGILLESSSPSSGKRIDWLTIGFGVNLAWHPKEGEVGNDAWRATDIACEAGGPAPAPEAAFALLADAFAARYEQWAAMGFAPIREAWLAQAARLGQPITARMSKEVCHGVFADVDADGTLVLETPKGVRRIAVADVYFP